MEGYQRAAIKSRTSLATVNIGQSLIMNGGLIAIMLLSAFEIKQALTDLEKMFVLMGLEPEIIDHPDARDIHDVKGHIAFDKVIFNYDDDRTILDDISFDIQPGQTVAVHRNCSTRYSAL